MNSIQKLIEASSYIHSKTGTRHFNPFMQFVKEDPERYFMKKDLLNEYLEYADYFKDEESFFKLLVENNYYKADEKYQSNNSCIICGEKTKFRSLNHGYAKTCGKGDCIGKCRRLTMENNGTWNNMFHNIKNTWKNKTPEEIQESTNKAKETKLKKYGDPNYNNHKKITETMLERYGSEHALQNHDIKSKFKATLASKTDEEKALSRIKFEESMLEKYNVRYPYQSKEISKKGIKKMRVTNTKNGKWVPDELKTDYELYVREVRKETERVYKEYIDIIDPERKRKCGEYELDHIFSKKDGFLNNIPICYIANVSNLRIITKSENASKNYKSDKTIEQLFEDFREI